MGDERNCASSERRQQLDQASSIRPHSDVAPDLGLKPEPVKHVQQSTQDRLNETWKKFANVVDCNVELQSMKNGRSSAGKCTRHVKTKHFHATDAQNQGDLEN